MKLSPLFKCPIFAANKKIRIFGEAQSEIIAYLGNKTAVSKNENGSFLIEFEPMDYCGPFDIRLVCENEEYIIKNAYVGEVILAAGQSNMEYKMRDGEPTQKDIAALPLVREISTKNSRFTEQTVGEKFFFDDGWVDCTLDNAPYFSAIAYYVAREIAREKNCAVGIVGVYQGASVIESFMSKEALCKLNYFLSDEERKAVLSHFWNRDSFMYEKQFLSAVPYSFSRVLWYQGESNSNDRSAFIYEELLSALISLWRSDLMDEALPFTVVQIADTESRLNDKWKSIQKAQEKVEKTVIGVKSIKSADISERDNIHPPTKLPLAMRIYDTFK